MAELEKCPYCGGEAKLFPKNYGYCASFEIWRKFALQCSKCGAEPFELIEVQVGIDDDGNVIISGNLDEVIAKWNRRGGNG